jgi:hypothetical protein
MARPRVADGGTASKYGGVAANMQSRTADKGWSSSLGLGEVLTTPHRKKLPCYETFNKASDLDVIFG